MKEYEYLRKKGILLTEKQYKKYFTSMILWVSIPAIISFIGVLITAGASSKTVAVAGIIIAGMGVVFLIFGSFWISIRYTLKLRVYYQFKKHPENYNNVIAFDFYTSLLNNDKLFNICCLFGLQDIYMGIYSVDMREKDLYKTLVSNKLISQIVCNPKEHLQDIHMKLTVNDLPAIIELLSEFDFVELTICDCYTSLEKFLENKTTLLKKALEYNTSASTLLPDMPTKFYDGGKFHLFYYPKEGQQTEIICYILFDRQDLSEQISSILTKE